MWGFPFLRNVLGPFIRVYYPLRLHGAISTIPPSGGVLVIANHCSFLDPWLLAILYPRLVRYLINERWYRSSRAWTTLFDAYGCVPISDGDPKATLESACAVLARGEVLGVFPEGRISYDARVKRFRTGLAFMAARSGAPVQPVGLRGTFECLPRDRRIPRRHPMDFYVGEPRRFPGSPTLEPPSRVAVRDFLDLLYDDILRLSERPPALREREAAGTDP